MISLQMKLRQLNEKKKDVMNLLSQNLGRSLTETQIFQCALMR